MNRDDEREDMLGILRKYRPFYFAVFIVQVIAWCILLVGIHIRRAHQRHDWQDNSNRTEDGASDGSVGHRSHRSCGCREVSSGSSANSKYPTKNHGESQSRRHSRRKAKLGRLEQPAQRSRRPGAAFRRAAAPAKTSPLSSLVAICSGIGGQGIRRNRWADC